jgi:small-conductance mechanosensitive channel
MSALVGASSAAMLPVGLLIFLPASVVLAIHLYRRRQQLGPIKPSLGARLGVFTGLLGFAVFLIVFVLTVASNATEYRETIARGLKEAATRNPNPQVQMMQTFFSGTAGILVLTATYLAIALVFFLIISSLTGALTATVSRGKKTL